MAGLSVDDYIAAFRADGQALAVAARKADDDHPVRSCPGWQVVDLVAHAWTFVTSLRIGDWKPPADVHDVNVDDFEKACHDLLEAWGRREPRGARRCANEISVHRWDAEDAIGAAEPIDTTLAADGVDEFFRVFVAPPQWGGGKGDGESIRIIATDTDLDLAIRFEPDGFQWGVADGRPPTIVRGPASNLQLFLWGRLPASALQVEGDAAAVRRKLESPRFA